MIFNYFGRGLFTYHIYTLGMNVFSWHMIMFLKCKVRFGVMHNSILYIVQSLCPYFEERTFIIKIPAIVQPVDGDTVGIRDDALRLVEMRWICDITGL